MKLACNVATLIERFFTDRLTRQRTVSADELPPWNWRDQNKQVNQAA
ncbi:MULTISPECIES: hypothetical protein [unclassified Bradyrhizobium]